MIQPVTWICLLSLVGWFPPVANALSTKGLGVRFRPAASADWLEIAFIPPESTCGGDL